MKSLFLAALVSLIGATSTSFADPLEMGSIFHHRASEGKFEVWPFLTYTTIDYKMNGSSSWPKEVKTSGMVETIRGEYGITEDFTIALDLSFAQLKNKFSPEGTHVTATQVLPSSADQKGMMDPTVHFIGKTKAVGPGTLYYALPVTISTGKGTTDEKLEQNMKSGGTSIAPWLGYEMNMGPGLLGLHLSYMTFLTERKVEKKNVVTAAATNYTRTDGEKLEADVFYEYGILPYLFVGAGVGYSAVNSTFTKTDNTGVGANDDNGVSGMSYGVYGTMAFSQNILITPTIRFDQTGDTSTLQHVKSVDAMTATVYGLFIF